MLHLSLSTQMKSFETLDEQYDNINSINGDLNDVKFEECFTKVFSDSKIIDIDSDNELDFFIKENPCLEINDIYSVKNKEKTLNILNIKSKEKEEISKEISSFVGSDKSFIKNLSIKNVHFPLEQTEKKEVKKEGTNLLGKKRNFFKIDYPKDFHIFNCGQYNQYSRQKIDEVMKELSNNNSKEERDYTTINSGNKKKYKKIKNVQKRKENADNIRKKIKSRFLKVLRNTVNERLKIAGSKKFFKFLSQKFISNVSREKNKAALDLTFKEIFSKDFCEAEEKDQTEYINYKHNLEVLKYLEENKEISEISNFNIFKNMKYSQIYNEYLKSKEFEIEIASLKTEKENEKYIKDYIIKASDLIDFFTN